MDELRRRKLQGTIKTLYQCFKTHETNGDSAFYVRPELGWEMLEGLEDLLGISSAGDEPAADEGARHCTMGILLGTIDQMRGGSPAGGVPPETWSTSADLLEHMARTRFGREWERFREAMRAAQAHTTSTE